MRTEPDLRNATSWKDSTRTVQTALALLVGLASLSACGGMPPVDATRPSEDPLILNASPTMSGRFRRFRNTERRRFKRASS